MRVEHELHHRRRGRNFGVLAVLLAFILVVFGVTVAKIQTGGLAQGFDHVLRPEILPQPTPAETPQTEASQ